MTQLPYLTTYELVLLSMMLRSSGTNGHDFGFIEDLTDGVAESKKKVIGGGISSLVKKGLIKVWNKEEINDSGECYTQFTWRVDVSTVLKAIYGEKL